MDQNFNLNKLVSIVVPIYNEEDNIRDLLNSIIGQTYKNLEIIIVDDGSQDQTLDLCNSIAMEDSRIKVVSKENGGVSSARNVGIEISNGEYICFLDGDDYIEESLVLELVSSMENTRSDVTFTGYNLLYGEKKIPRENSIKSGVYASKELLSTILDNGTMSGIQFGSACTSIYKLETIKYSNIRFNESIRINEDGIFNIEFVLSSDIVCINNEIKLYNYRQSNLNKRSYEFLKENIEISTKYLESNFSGVLPNFENQIACRKVSEALWLILNLCQQDNIKYSEIKIELMRIISSAKDSLGLSLVEENELGKHKFAYYYLIRKEMSKTIYFLTRYIVPVFTRIMNR